MMDSSYSERLSINFTTSPTYLNIFLPSVENIILVHDKQDKVDHCEDSNSYVVNNPSPYKMKDCRLDLTGSPLKCALDNSEIMSTTLYDISCKKWLRKEESHYPITLEEARNFLTDYHSKKQTSVDEKPVSVWCVCDGSDGKRIILLSSEQNSHFITRSFVKIDGCFPIDDPALNMNALVQQHLSYQWSANVAAQQVKKYVVCVYEILGSSIIEMNINDETNGCVLLEVVGESFSDSEKMNNFETVLVVQTIMGQHNSPVYIFWKELLHLELCTNFLTQCNSDIMNNNWIPHESSSMTREHFIDSVIEIVKESQTILRCAQKGEGVNLKRIISSCVDRNTKDVTDKLWSVLIKCPTYGILVDCLDVLFTEIAYNDLKCFVTDCNRTVMADIIRGIMAGKMRVPRLAGVLPLFMLVEIGIDKLRKDYVHIFCNAGLKRADEFHSMFDIQGDASRRRGLDANIKRSLFSQVEKLQLNKVMEHITLLGQLQVVLETLLLVPCDLVSYTTRPAFQQYVGPDSAVKCFVTSDSKRLYELRIPVPVTEVHQHIRCIEPATRTARLTSAQPTFQVETTFYQSRHCVFPPNVCAPGTVDETEKLKNGNYHCSCLVKLRNTLRRNE